MKSHRTDLKNIARRAMVERGLLPDFSAAAMAELARIEAAATDRDSDIRDLTELLWASIDNDDSRDLDQLTVAEPGAGRSVKILVAIADVDALVAKDSALDAHAKHNTTSVYTAGDMFPMLPEKLSTDLTSLGEGQDRFAVIVEMVIAEDGVVLSSTLFRALVRNHAKLAYNSVAAWLAGEAPAPERVNVVSGLDAQLRLQDQIAQRLKVRSMVGLLPLCAATVFEGQVMAKYPELTERLQWFLTSRPELYAAIHDPTTVGVNGRRLASILDETKLRRVLSKMLNEREFLSPYGLRSLSRYHADHPYVIQAGGQEDRVSYLPGESDSGMFGGNSNWRGPIWMPVNVLIIRALLHYHLYYGDSFTVECPTGSGQQMNLYEVAQEIGRRLSNIFLKDKNDRRPVYG